MSYKETLELIHSKKTFSQKPGLHRIGALLSMLQNPQDKLKVIHIAGTNGKGSTCSMCSEILKEAGYKVGKFISPYLYDFRERISINGENISEKRLEELTLRVLEIDKTLEERTNEFEFITALAYLYFYEEKVDVAIMEVGLGGRFDATNIIKSPQVSILASISLDHTGILGDRVSQIAYEKAGIIKENVPTICYALQNPEAREVIEKCCHEKNSSLIIPSPSVEVLKSDINGTSFRYKDKEFFINMLLDHQIYNALSVIECCYYLRDEKGFDISDDDIKKGLENTFFPARFEIFSKEPPIIIDGSHNVEGLTSLSNGIQKYFKDKNIILLLSMVKDKDYIEGLKIMDKIAHKAVITEIENNPRAEKAEKLAENLSCPHIIEKDNKKAVELSLSLTEKDKNAVLIICGSLYLAGDMTKILRQIKPFESSFGQDAF
ncbi:MAG: bifunctional folylpolyglutamate synthase/dihydrofolate synthase [Clostridia bacterium]|nr:bifunctional folylpolyglutamate synthase/dihydrofolate synthase [Clostridia bacterium]